VDTVAAQAVLQSALLGDAPPRHLHTPGREPVILAERFVGGARHVTYACCTCGEALPERRA
jgi:hypothetical protein